MLQQAIEHCVPHKEATKAEEFIRKPTKCEHGCHDTSKQWRNPMNDHNMGQWIHSGTHKKKEIDIHEEHLSYTQNMHAGHVQ